MLLLSTKAGIFFFKTLSAYLFIYENHIKPSIFFKYRIKYQYYCKDPQMSTFGYRYPNNRFEASNSRNWALSDAVAEVNQGNDEKITSSLTGPFERSKAASFNCKRSNLSQSIMTLQNDCMFTVSILTCF